MFNLPLIKTTRIDNRKSLTTRLDELLEECEQVGDISKLNIEVNRNFLEFSNRLETIRQEKIFNEAEKVQTSRKIDSYIRKKYHATNTNSYANECEENFFTFDSYNNSPNSKNILLTRRKFGRFSQDYSNTDNIFVTGNFSNTETKDFFRVTGKSEIAEKISPRKKVDNLIRKYLGKILGAKYYAKLNATAKERLLKKVERKKRKAATFIQQPKLSLIAKNESENEYLKPEYLSFLQDTKHKLMLEKFIKAQHQKGIKQILDLGEVR